MNEPIVVTYLVYLAISIALTIWVGQTLHKNGRVFLVDVFRGNAELANSVNRLLVVGFYLVNFGFVSLAMRSREQVTTARQSIELLSSKIGLVLIVLGWMHLMNVWIFNAIRRRALDRERREARLPASHEAGQWASRPAST